MTMQSLLESISEGMHNAVVCTEDVPFFDLDEARLAALADTYLGELQVVSLSAVCEIWPAGFLDEDFHAPLESDVPVMLLSGTDDPVTPPRNGEQAAAGLSNSLHIIGQGHGHGMLTLGCVPDLIADFVETASLDELDIDCVDEQRAEPFFTSFSGPEP
jgi:pimeloyl-ACP methyl ester carboxylesterase